MAKAENANNALFEEFHQLTLLAGDNTQAEKDLSIIERENGELKERIDRLHKYFDFLLVFFDCHPFSCLVAVDLHVSVRFLHERKAFLSESVLQLLLVENELLATYANSKANNPAADSDEVSPSPAHTSNQSLALSRTQSTPAPTDFLDEQEEIDQNEPYSRVYSVLFCSYALLPSAL